MFVFLIASVCVNSDYVSAPTKYMEVSRLFALIIHPFSQQVCQLRKKKPKARNGSYL